MSTPAAVAEHVRVAADQLLGDVRERVRDREVPVVRLDLREEHALEDEVADLAAQAVVVAAVDGVEHLVGLLEHESAQRLDRLLVIPGAAARAAQPRHDVDQSLERLAARRAAHRALMLAFPGDYTKNSPASPSPAS